MHMTHLWLLHQMLHATTSSAIRHLIQHLGVKFARVLAREVSVGRSSPIEGDYAVRLLSGLCHQNLNVHDPEYSPAVSGTKRYAHSMPTAATQAYSQNAREPPSTCVRVRKVWLTSALVSQFADAATPLPSPLSCNVAHHMPAVACLVRHQDWCDFKAMCAWQKEGYVTGLLVVYLQLAGRPRMVDVQFGITGCMMSNCIQACTRSQQATEALTHPTVCVSRCSSRSCMARACRNVNAWDNDWAHVQRKYLGIYHPRHGSQAG